MRSAWPAPINSSRLKASGWNVRQPPWARRTIFSISRWTMRSTIGGRSDRASPLGQDAAIFQDVLDRRAAAIGMHASGEAVAANAGGKLRESGAGGSSRSRRRHEIVVVIPVDGLRPGAGLSNRSSRVSATAEARDRPPPAPVPGPWRGPGIIIRGSSTSTTDPSSWTI